MIDLNQEINDYPNNQLNHERAYDSNHVSSSEDFSGELNINDLIDKNLNDDTLYVITEVEEDKQDLNLCDKYVQVALHFRMIDWNTFLFCN